MCLCFDLIQDQRTALHWTAESECGGLEKVHFLLQKGVNVNIQSKVSLTLNGQVNNVFFCWSVVTLAYKSLRKSIFEGNPGLLITTLATFFG